MYVCSVYIRPGAVGLETNCVAARCGEIKMFIFMILSYRIIEIATKMYVLQGKVSILLFHRDMEL